MKRLLSVLLSLLAVVAAYPQAESGDVPAVEPVPFERSSSQQAVKVTSDVGAVVLPLTALTASLVSRDWQGAKQFALSAATAAGVTLILKYSIHKRRPDGSDFHSMNSAHSAASFVSAAYIQRRYGWKFGIPAYALAAYVGWARIYSKKHDIWDVLAGAAIGVGSAYIYTRPFAQKHNLSIAPVTDGRNFGFSAAFTF